MLPNLPQPDFVVQDQRLDAFSAWAPIPGREEAPKPEHDGLCGRAKILEQSIGLLEVDYSAYTADSTALRDAHAADLRPLNNPAFSPS